MMGEEKICVYLRISILSYEYHCCSAELLVCSGWYIAGIHIVTFLWRSQGDATPMQSGSIISRRYGRTKQSLVLACPAA